MKPRLYIDTSVISALHDTRTPERREQTVAFWNRLADFHASTSDAARLEISNTPDAQHRANMTRSLDELAVLAVTREIEALADQ